MPTPRSGAALVLACLLVTAPHLATAQTDEIQVYNAEITAPGHWNLTWHNNFTPSGRATPDFPGGIVPNHALNGVPEWALGLTDWFEGGLYLPVYTRTPDGALLFDSAKLRALFVVPDAHDRSFFYGLNFELSYNTPHWEPSRFSGEIRPIIGWHLGRCDLIVNPILDTDFNGLARLDFAPAVRAAYNFNRKMALALEEYADYGPLDHLRSGPNQQHTLFAVLDLGSSTNGLEFGIGRGLTHASDSTVLKLMLMHDL
ncbi:MAG TPA: hypothetical protein VM713_00600 [Steroidobacteraceae bacterium]|nr:hypothetical protein [Steroidobacteraceae bacterium]